MITDGPASGPLDSHRQVPIKTQKKRRQFALAPQFSERQSVLEAATAATTAEVSTRGATITLLRFIDLQRTTAEVLAIERLHGAGGIGIRHLDETEATRAAGFAIVHQGHLVDGAMGCEVGAHLIFGGIERKISNVKFHPEELTEKRDGDRFSPAYLVREYLRFRCRKRHGVNEESAIRRARYRKALPEATVSRRMGP